MPSQLFNGSFQQAAQTSRAAENIVRMQRQEQLEIRSTESLKRRSSQNIGLSSWESLYTHSGQKSLGGLHDQLWDSPRLLTNGSV